MTAARMTADTSRRDELTRRWAELQQRVDAACAAAGRDRSEVTVVAITKTFPAGDIALLAELGVRDVGENRDQEAGAKAAACRDMGISGLRWHFVGQLQTNKARSVAGYADVVHSVDRVRLVEALDAGAVRHERRVDCLVQVDLDPGIEPVGDADSDAARVAARAGVEPSRAHEICAAIEQAEHLQLAGLMGIAPLGGDPGEAFARLSQLRRALASTYPQIRVVSAGMSDDLEAAVAHGATHLRVGRALLGSRPPLG
jgi:pyridoxal phosphate enzyme (YggS family)